MGMLALIPEIMKTQITMITTIIKDAAAAGAEGADITIVAPTVMEMVLAVVEDGAVGHRELHMLMVAVCLRSPRFKVGILYPHGRC